jgi:tetratricopeptide (TPR) repeat protein
MRNTKWTSAEILWKDAATKGEMNARPYSYLGQLYAWEKPKSRENLEKAVAYYQQALNKTGPLSRFHNAIYGNIAGAYFNYGDYDLAREYYMKAIATDTRFPALGYGLAKVLVLLEDFERTLFLLDTIIDNPNTKNLDRAYNLRGLVRLWTGDYDSALRDIRSALQYSYNKASYYYNLGSALSLSGYPQQAEWFYKSLLKRDPGDITIMLSLIENAARAGETEKAEKYASNLFLVFPLSTINDALQDKGVERYRSAPIDYDLVRPLLDKARQNITTYN